MLGVLMFLAGSKGNIGKKRVKLEQMLNINLVIFLTPKFQSYRNQSIDLQSKLMSWFLYDGNFGF